MIDGGWSILFRGDLRGETKRIELNLISFKSLIRFLNTKYIIRSILSIFLMYYLK